MKRSLYTAILRACKAEYKKVVYLEAGLHPGAADGQYTYNALLWGDTDDLRLEPLASLEIVCDGECQIDVYVTCQVFPFGADDLELGGNVLVSLHAGEIIKFEFIS